MGHFLYFCFSWPAGTLLQYGLSSEMMIIHRVVSGKTHLTCYFLNTRDTGREYRIKLIYQSADNNYKK